ncbi:MAG: hypothetical protein AAF225_03820 [Pseudomonadota bacterium]
MVEFGHRSSLTIRLLGPSSERARWRKPLIAEGFVIPVGGSTKVCLVDLAGKRPIDLAIEEAQAQAGVTPLVVVIGLDDPLPCRSHPGIVLVRRAENSIDPVPRALRQAVHHRLLADAASVRYRALSGLGLPFRRDDEFDDIATPCALLAEPGPAILPILNTVEPKSLATSLSSSGTLRLLEGGHTSGLMIHIQEEREHRLPVLKLIRRQTDLAGLPVAVTRNQWDDEAMSSWLSAGADLIARPEEAPEVLAFLKGRASRFKTARQLKASLAGSTVNEAGEPAPLFGESIFRRICEEHHTQGHIIAYGAIELSAETTVGAEDFAEAGIYLGMALTPLEAFTRLRDNLYVVAMPGADAFYARRVMRAMQTLIEDLKFGDEPAPLMMSARHASFAAVNEPPGEAITQMMEDLRNRSNTSLFA